MNIFRNVSEATVGLSELIAVSGGELESRAGLTREIINNTLTITNPMERYLSVANRFNDPIASIVETFWVLAGYDDISYILPYLPRAAEFSDDGKTWRAGYGPRLRDFGSSYRPSDPVDQLMATVHHLNKYPDSRRAVMSIFDPNLDIYVESKDIPCNNWLDFRIVEGALHLAVAVRSNDLVWGFSGINTFEWSILQQLMAEWTNSSVGTQTWIQGSVHMYERHFKNFPGGSAPFELNPQNFRTCDLPISISPDCFDEEMMYIFETLYAWENKNVGIVYTPVNGVSPLFSKYMEYIRAYWVVRHQATGNLEDWVGVFTEIYPATGAGEATDLEVAMDEYFTRLISKTTGLTRSEARSLTNANSGV